MSYDTRLQAVRQKQEFFDQFCGAWLSEYRQRGGSIHCGKGCSGCCSLVVNCTISEASAIARAVTPEQQVRLQAAIPAIQECARQAASLKEWLKSYRNQAGPCSFLESDGSCGMYQLRPLSCRSLLATKGPHWCTTDFATLSGDERQAYMERLDRSVVAFPTHYAATPQEMAQELELADLRELEQDYGCSVLGNLPWLVWLVLEHRLDELLSAGAAAMRTYLNERGLASPYLVVIGD